MTIIGAAEFSGSGMDLSALFRGGRGICRRRRCRVSNFAFAVRLHFLECGPYLRGETYAALKLEIDSWRWRGVPFYVRAGKSLPVTITEVVVRLRRPPTMFQSPDLQSNYFRFRISPDNSIAFGLNFATPGDEAVGVSTEITGCRQPVPDDMDAYERVLGDAMAGDAALFAREDYVKRPGESSIRR
jgi:Glucose-6-phosphate dehydrogenase, C-terminal domain